MSLARRSGRGWRSRVRVVGMNFALKHGRKSIGVELDTAYCKQAASRLMNENTSLFGNAQLQIELKPHTAVETVAALKESAASPIATRRERSEGRRRAGRFRS